MVLVATRSSMYRVASLLTRVKVTGAISTANTSTTAKISSAQAQVKEPLAPPHLDGQSKEYSPKIQTLVDEISKLNLIEVSDLNELLRKRLNIKDVPMAVGFASGAAAPQAAAKKAADEDKADDAPKAVKSSFNVKLVKFDDAKKVALIKEIKGLVENMNLVQAKKFVESAPQILKKDVTKDDAEKLKASLEKVGATIEIE
jgi:large subunit ribosomal protein L7/L12